MGDNYSQQYDLITLLKMGDLDIRKVAKNSQSMRVQEYFIGLSKFIDFTPKAVEIINKIAERKCSENDFSNLSYMKSLLADIGCFDFMSGIDDVLNAGRNSHNEYAAFCAKKISEDFTARCTGICTRLLTAKNSEDSKVPVEESETEEIISEDDTETYETYTLKNALELIQHEEETRKMKILAIDDAPVMLKTISSVLSDEYKVYGMTDPTMLEKFLQQITPELFLLDYQMPKLNGFELVPVIRGFKEHEDTPIIFLTSKGTIDHVSAAFALGASDFIVKPFQGNILREKVAKHIVRKKLF